MDKRTAQARAIRIGLMALTMLPGLMGLVFFSLPYARAVNILEQLSLGWLSVVFTEHVFASYAQPVRLVGAILLTMGLGLLSMPKRTLGWIESCLLRSDKFLKASEDE